MASSYLTKWVTELPQIGTECPACGAGLLVDNSFLSKKGTPFKSVSCKECRTDWVLSQWQKAERNFKTTPQIKKENEEFEVEDEAQKILTAITLMKGQLVIIENAMKEGFKDIKKELRGEVEE